MTIPALALTPLANAGPVIGFIVVALGLGIVVAVASARARRRRQEALRAWAAAHGLDYQPEEVSTLESRFQGFGCLTEGNNRFPSNLLAGMYGFKTREYFEIEDSSQRLAPAVDLEA